ncbi:MAG: enoyl-CoA hydratase [Gammaproteobacteria bacterium]|nr:MAG: enoyl-CoA hydratase [Gammaproteobacteria bacterium]
MDAEPAVLLARRADGVVTITLNRPQVGNAMNLNVTRELLRAAIACDEDPAVRCVVLTGAGRLFCAGGDLADFAEAGDRLPVLLKELTAALHMAIARFARMEKPLVTIINGPAAGAGFSLALLGDIVLAARSAHFTLAYGGIGLSPDGGVTWLLPRLAGLRRAQELILTNRRIDADEAADLGLITRAVDDESLAGQAEVLATSLGASATFALGKMRNLLLLSFSATLETQMEAEARAIAETARSPHGREGIDAFLQQRKPTFS